MPFFGGGGGDYHIVATNIKGGTSAAPAVIGTNNMALGNGALQSALLADNNVAIGNLALNAITTGSFNISIGYNSFPLAQTSAYLTIVGDNTGAQSTGSQESVIIGHGAFSSTFLQPHTANAAQQSVIIGTYAVPSGDVSSSVFIGSSTRQGNAALSTNAVVIGANTLGSDSSVVIGAGAVGDLNSIAIGKNVSANANQIIIGDATYTTVKIGGVTLSSAGGSAFPNGATIGNVGTEGTGITVGGVTYNSVLKVSDIGGTNIAQSILHRHSTTWEAINVLARSNSDTTAHGVVTNGMGIGGTYAVGWTGTEYNICGRLHFEMAAAGAISDTSSPGDIVLSTTPAGTIAPVEAMRVRSDKSTVFSGGVVYPSVTFAALPAAASYTNQIFNVSDIGPNGSLWVSNGTEWVPVNGRALYKRGNYPVGMPNNGTVGANGALTLNGTGLVNTYSGGVWLFFPAGAVYAGSVAGFYWAVMSSATVGTIYNGVHNGATEFLPAIKGVLTPIVSAAIGAYLAVGVATQAAHFDLPGNLLGESGAIEGIVSATFTSSPSSKSVQTYLNFGQINGLAATTTNSFNGYIKTRNRTPTKQVNNFNGLIQTPNTGGITFTSIDTTVSNPFDIVLTDTGSNNDCLIIESVDISIVK